MGRKGMIDYEIGKGREEIEGDRTGGKNRREEYTSARNTNQNQIPFKPTHLNHPLR